MAREIGANGRKDGLPIYTMPLDAYCWR